jgi:hypothetical protein
LVDEIRIDWPAIDNGAGTVRAAPTVLTRGGASLAASAVGTTRLIRFGGC